MDDATTAPSGLIAVRGLPREEMEKLCSKHAAEIAIVNGEDHFVVGGTLESLDRVASAAAPIGAVVTRLRVAVAAHTRFLASATPRFRAALEASPIVAPKTPVLAGINAAAVQDREAATTLLSRQISTAVQWSACLDAAYERGCRVFLELGPGDGLARMARTRFPRLAIRSVADFRGVDGAAAWVNKNL